jgi:EmrB/QacA subfamily drug resistance transporter
LADRFGRRLMFVVGLVVFSAASLWCGSATDPLLLVIARAAQGIGGAMMFATSLALLADAFRGKDRGAAFGLYGAITGMAVAIGPVLGGAITSWLSWRWIFFINLPIGVATIAMTLLRVPESRDPRAARPDFAGFITFSLGLGALVFGLIRSTSDGWGSATVVGCLAASGVLLCVFAVIESRISAPMLDPSLLRVPTFNGGLAAAFAIAASLFSLLTYLVIYIQNILGLSPIATGVRFLPLTGAVFLTAGVAGRLTSQVPRRALIAPGFVLIGVGLFLMRGLTVQSSWTHLLAGMIIAGVGAGLVNVPLASTAVGVVEPARAGMASGINNTFRQVGTATGVAALGTILASHIQSDVTSRLAGTSIAARGASIGHAIATGGAAPEISTAPSALRGLVVFAGRSAFVGGLDLILLIGAIISLVAAAVSLVLIRERDFVVADSGESAPPAVAPDERSVVTTQ